MEHKQIVVGDYVFTPCKNVFNSKTSYWVSKRGYMVAVYAFSPMSSADLKRLTTEENLKAYILVFDNVVGNMKNK